MSNWLATQANALLDIDQAQQESRDLQALAEALETKDPVEFLDRLREDAGEMVAFDWDSWRGRGEVQA